MATTAIVAEIVIGGLEAAVWIALYVFAIAGTDWVDFAQLSDWQATILLLLVAAAYVLGILIDRIADSVLSRADRIAFGKPKLRGREVQTMRVALLHHEDGNTRFLEYQRSRMRVARATVLNLVLLAPALAAFLLARTDAGSWTAVAVLGVVAAAFVSWWVARRIEVAFLNNLRRAYAELGRA